MFVLFWSLVTTKEDDFENFSLFVDFSLIKVFKEWSELLAWLTIVHREINKDKFERRQECIGNSEICVVA